jgi:hypothetical protein
MLSGFLDGAGWGFVYTANGGHDRGHRASGVVIGFLVPFFEDSPVFLRR